MLSVILTWALSLLSNQPHEPAPVCIRGWHRSESYGNGTCIRGLHSPGPAPLYGCRDDLDCAARRRCVRIGSGPGRCRP